MPARARLHADGSPFLGDLRQCLARQIGKNRPLDLRSNFGLEMEFYLLRQVSGSSGNGQADRRGCYLSVQELNSLDWIINGISAACAKQRIPVDTSLCGNTAGQFEVSLGHQPAPLKAADDARYFEHFSKNVARKMGYAATFIAKPFSGMPGKRIHAHISVADKAGGYIFDNGKAPGSGKLRHAVGGLIEALPDLTDVLAPHPNSFRRLANALPAGAGWGHEKRLAAIRIPVDWASPAARERPPRGTAMRLRSSLRNCPPIRKVRSRSFARATRANVRGTFTRETRDMYAACKQQERTVFSGHVNEFERSSHLAHAPDGITPRGGTAFRVERNCVYFR